MKNLMRRLAVWLLGNRVDTPAAPVPPPVANPLRVPAIVAARARQPGPSAAAGNQPPPSPFKLPDFPKSSMPPDGNPTMAQDDAISESLSWAQNSLMQQYGSYLEGQTFLGYPKLAELAQRPEYRRISQTHARHMTRKWIKFNSAGGEDKQERIRELEKEIERLHLKDRFREVVEQDGFFGRSHLFLDFGATNPDELKMPIGDGTSDLSKSKIAKGSLKAVRCIEAVWCYPQSYNSIDPLRPDWYRPEHWYVQTRQVHRSRLLTFVGREVPDMLKPAYGFGGLPLTQMAKPYVDNWLRTRQSVADLVEAFSVMVLGTNIIDQMNAQDGDPLFARVDLFNNLRNNRGTMVIDKNSETLTNVSAPLGTLDALQAQSQEHMASVSGIPLIFLLGITPTGLNACLPGDTLILTDRGQVPIREVKLSDRVMTRRGLAPLTFSGITQYATELIEIRTAGKILRCTANHPIWLPSTNAFVRADRVRSGDRLLLTGGRNADPRTPRPWHGEDSGGGSERTDTTPLGIAQRDVPSFSIGGSGRRIADQFQRISKSTIATAIRGTISSPISSLYMRLTTPRFTTLIAAFAHGESMDLNQFVAPTAERSSPSRSFRVERSSALTIACLPTAEQRAYQEHVHQRSVLASCAELFLALLRGAPNIVRANVQLPARTALNTIARTISRILRSSTDINEQPGEHPFGMSRENASDAVSSSCRADDATNCIAQSLARTEPDSGDTSSVISIRRIPANEWVYDLSVVPGHLPEFFANGILTHNSSDGEIRAFYDDIHSQQESFFRPNLQAVSAFVQLSLWGAVDPDLTFEFVDLWSLDDEKRASVRKTEAETDDIYVAMGAVDPKEVRVRLAGDPEEPYGIDPANPEEGMPEPPPAPPMPGDPAQPGEPAAKPGEVPRGSIDPPQPIARVA